MWISCKFLLVCLPFISDHFKHFLNGSFTLKICLFNGRLGGGGRQTVVSDENGPWEESNLGLKCLLSLI